MSDLGRHAAEGLTLGRSGRGNSPAPPSAVDVRRSVPSRPDAVRHNGPARLVRAREAPAAVARHARSVRAAGQRGDAPADAGGARGAVLRGVPRAFPDPQALAAAPPRDVLAAWSGLGYNRRALALRAAARRVAARGWPADLAELPGVGPYTAAAVASFAWDAQRAAVDTNVRRVLERFDGAAPRPPRSPSGRRRWSRAGRRRGVQPGDDGARRHGLPPRAPLCPACPVRDGCAAHAAGGPAAPRPGAGARHGSRTPIAGRAAGPSLRCCPASCRRPRSAASGASACWQGSSATA